MKHPRRNKYPIFVEIPPNHILRIEWLYHKSKVNEEEDEQWEGICGSFNQIAQAKTPSQLKKQMQDITQNNFPKYQLTYAK